MVKVIGGGAEFDEGRSGKTLLRIKVTAEVDGVRSDYEITLRQIQQKQRFGLRRGESRRPRRQKRQTPRD